MKNTLRRIPTYLVFAYFIFIFLWVVAYLVTRDQIREVSIINMFAIYIFLPLPLFFILALYVRRKEGLIDGALALIVFILFWGRLFIPHPQLASAEGDRLSVMTYNLLGWQSDIDQQIETIRQENPDVVLLQELNPVMAAALKSDLLDEYPYQVLDPADGVEGMGVISKYPIQPTEAELPLGWVGTPQVLEMDWNGRSTKLVNFHMQPSDINTLSKISGENRRREAQARALADLALDAGPLIVGGDANATPMNTPYRIITGELKDSWLEAGFWLGHTFPGSDVQGSSRPRLAGFPVPKWLMRIDYIFHTPHWRAVSAHTAPFDGVSDHRGVVTTLIWDADN
jgi:endonuclease/exonuclease/phosphatase (EEP) superfamily protein YafD